MSLLIVQTAAQTLVQDKGRLAYARFGVPAAGPFDRRSWRLANRLVGNPQDAAVLEVLGGGLIVQAQRHLTVAVCGAQGTVRINHTLKATHEPLHLAPGQQMSLDPPTVGLRYYLSVSGGLALPEVLGSQASDTLGKLGPTLGAGDLLPTGPRHGRPVVDHVPPRPATQIFEVTPGPDLDFGQLLKRDWDLDPQSNRIGVRLTGTPLPAPTAALPSKPMVRGAVQLPPNGLPIILGPDHPTTGGYPVIAVVTEASMDDVAQWPGGTRRFRLVT